MKLKMHETMKSALMATLLVAALFIGVSFNAENAIAASGDDGAGPNLITSIETVVGAGSTTIEIRSERPANYTVFKLKKPTRVVVDISGASDGDVKPSYRAGSGPIKDMTVSSIGDDPDYPMTRLSITLDGEARYNVTKNGNLISVRLDGVTMPDSSSGMEYMAAPEPYPASDADLVPPPVVDYSLDDMGEKEMLQQEKLSTDNADVKSVEEVPIDLPPLQPARNISDINTARDTADVLNVTIDFDGKVGSYDAFEMRNPPRLVVDFWGVGTTHKISQINVMENELKSVRVGKHSNKVRVVFDAASSSEVPYYAFSKNREKLIVRISNSALNELSEAKLDNENIALASIDVAQADTGDEGPPLVPPPLDDEDDTGDEPAFAPMPPAEDDTSDSPPVMEEEPDLPPPPPAYVEPEEPVAYVPSAGYINIEGVDFDYTNKKSTIIISTSGRPEYEVLTNERTGVVSVLIKNATIPAQLERTLDTSEFTSHVQFVSSFQSGSGDARDVFVSVGNDVIPKHYVIREGNKLLAIFHNPPVQGQIGLHGDNTEYAGKDDNGFERESSVEEDYADLYFGGLRGIKKKTYTGRPIYIDAKGMNIVDAFRLIAEISHYNIITADDVKGSITLKLDNVPWDQALDIILESKGLAAIVRGNIMRIAPRAKLEGEIENEKKRRVKKVIDAPILFAAIPISYAEIGDMKSQVEQVLTKRGKAEADKRTNTLLIWDTVIGIEDAQRLVKTLDIETAQVLIEARIVEANTGVTRDLGVKWGVLYKSSATQGNPTGLNFPGTIDAGVGLLNNQSSRDPNDVFDSGIGDVGISFGSITDFLDLDLALHALEIEEKLKIISSPRIMTLDNEEASIQQGSSIPFQTTSAAGTRTEFVDANLNLTVKPHITADGSVFMKIKASANTPVTIPTAQGPGIDKKEAKTQILVKDGDTVVIGGIYIVTKSEPATRIPVLGRLPLIGWMFSSTSKSNSKRELLIFITPRIVTGGKRASFIQDSVE